MALKALNGPMRRGLFSLFFGTSITVLTNQYLTYHGTWAPGDGRFDVASMLGQYAAKGYSMATTEAGLLPFYSGWNAIDTWGLNDQWIAHHGPITADYLARRRPEIIIFHEFSSLITPLPVRSDPWSEMVKILKGYAEANGYVLAAAFGDSPHDMHYYYVRRDFAESREIISKIRALRYIWSASGRASNYVLVPPTPSTGALSSIDQEREQR